MREYNWKSEQFFIMLPDCFWVLAVELVVDWIKHAFITRFNEIPIEVYREYTVSIAYDVTQTRQKHAFSDHSDLLARRIGLLPYPLGVILVKALYHSLSFKNFGSIFLFILAYFCLFTCRVLNTICTLGKACDIMQKHQNEKIAEKIASQQQQVNQNPTTSIMKTTVKPLNLSTSISSTSSDGKIDIATSPLHNNRDKSDKLKTLTQSPDVSSSTSSPTRGLLKNQQQAMSVSSVSSSGEENLKINSALGATVIFSNSDVDLDDIGILNSKVIDQSVEDKIQFMDESLRHHGSEPDLTNIPNESSSDEENIPPATLALRRRSHKRSESEPFIQIDSTTTDRL
jgi:hypothetical protein